MTTALIAEDEPLLAGELREELGKLWPELEIAAVVHDGHAAIRELERFEPSVAFLDVQMPGLTGLDVARVVGGRVHLIFITAFDHYAVQAFDAGAVDYLLKPLDPIRLAQALKRLKERLHAPPADMSRMLDDLQRRPGDRLQWVTVLQGRDIQFIAVDDICYFRADNKYVAVVTPEGESLITTPLKELLDRLDASVFWQIHRGVIVNATTIKSVRRGITGNLEIKLKNRSETLKVSAGYAHLFKHM